jgi:hypothetical protein
MNNCLKKIIEQFKCKGKESVLILLLFFGVFVACQGVLEEGNPFAPSDSTLRISPSIVTVTTGADLNFVGINGSRPYSWTSSKINIGTIVANTGVFTAGTIPGSITITVIDAVGNTAISTVTVAAGVALTFDVAGATQGVIATADVITITANGSGVGFTTTIVNDDDTPAYELKPTIVSTGADITITSPGVLPTAAEGDQTYTITVTDANNGNAGTVSYILQAAAA